jgi:hypothetical protein
MAPGTERDQAVELARAPLGALDDLVDQRPQAWGTLSGRGGIEGAPASAEHSPCARYNRAVRRQSRDVAPFLRPVPGGVNQPLARPWVEEVAQAIAQHIEEENV